MFEVLGFSVGASFVIDPVEGCTVLCGVVVVLDAEGVLLIETEEVLDGFEFGNCFDSSVASGFGGTVAATLVSSETEAGFAGTGGSGGLSSGAVARALSATRSFAPLPRPIGCVRC